MRVRVVRAPQAAVPVSVPVTATGTPAMGNRCVCTTGTVQNKAGVQSKRRRKKLFSDMSSAPFAVVNKMARSPQVFTTPKVLQSVNLVDGRWQKVPLTVQTMPQTSNSRMDGWMDGPFIRGAIPGAQVARLDSRRP